MPEYGFDNCLLPMRSVEQLCVGSKTLSTSPLLCNEIAHTQIADVQDLCAGAEIMYDMTALRVLNPSNRTCLSLTSVVS